MERTLIDWMFECPYLTTICVMSIAAGISSMGLVKIINVTENKEVNHGAKNHD